MLLSIFKLYPPEQDPVIYAVPFFLLLIGIEVYLSYKEHRDNYVAKDALASIGMGLGSVAINVGMKGLAFGVYSMIYEFRLFEIGWHWWSWVLVFFADDFTFYWHHRLSHEVRILWSAHVNHHSSQKYTLATALRQSWGELLYKYIWWAWMPLVGFHPVMIFMMISFSLIYQFWIHTELINRFPKFIEFFFNTPSHHRVHHASNIRYLDRNHAGILIIWDKLFGTFSEELDSEKPIYGITKNIDTFNPLKIATHEFFDIINDVRNAPTFTDKLKYIFYPPGWSHNGPDQRAATLRKKLAKQE
jgi:sterol desaturase/sphingolipid hydroxylase (fatty acid hydroxylase superfamily)